MKHWLRLSLLLPIFSAAYTLITKEGVSAYDPLTFVSYSLAGASVLAIGNALLTSHLAVPNITIILGGLAVAGAIIAQAIAIDSAPNAGLASSVVRSQSAITVLAAVALLDGELDKIALASVAVTLIGVYFATTGTTTTDKRKAEEHRHTEDQTKSRNESAGKGWVQAALIAAGLLTAKDLLAVFSVRDGLHPIAAATIEITISAIATLMYKKITTGTFLPITTSTTPHPKWWVLPSGAVIMALWTNLVITAMTSAPNSGYPKALALSGVAIAAVISKYLYNEPLTTRAWSGIGFILLGTGGLIFQGH